MFQESRKPWTPRTLESFTSLALRLFLDAQCQAQNPLEIGRPNAGVCATLA